MQLQFLAPVDFFLKQLHGCSFHLGGIIIIYDLQFFLLTRKLLDPDTARW